MSWLARSFANTLRLDGDDDGCDGEPHRHPGRTPSSEPQTSSSSSAQLKEQDHHLDEEEKEYNHEDASRGVKEDLSEFKQTLTRQFWGVASFLAPPPPQTPSNSQAVRSVDSEWNRYEPTDLRSESGDEEEPSDSVGGPNVGSDFVDFRSGISKFASNFYSIESEEEEEIAVRNVVGVTEEVLAFARNIAMHPETWLDFPIDEEEDTDDFDLSDAQREHALAVEHLAPRLAALRIELCPCHMSEGYFWKVYFVLLHSRLNKHDAELLSTPQVMAARALWMQELHKNTKQEQEWSARSTSYSNAETLQDDFNPALYYDTHAKDRSLRTFPFEAATFSGTTDFETDKHLVASTEMQIVDKAVIEESSVIRTVDKEVLPGPSSKLFVQNYEDDGDDWLKDENWGLDGYSRAAISVGNEEDVSFSDLEGDDDIGVTIKSKNLKGY